VDRRALTGNLVELLVQGGEFVGQFGALCLGKHCDCRRGQHFEMPDDGV
jgi:hypothetical protein